SSFRGKTVIISGASRGIGKAIGLRLAKDGANIVIAAKSATPHPKLPGTIYTAAAEMEKAGGKALACVVDVRDQASIQKCVEETVAKFGGIDILINNASAISLTNVTETDMKRYDLMHSINTRGTYLFTKLCLPHLRESASRGRNPHILNISPPLTMESQYFSGKVAYTMAKIGMSMCVLGMAEEFKPEGIAVNALWPVTMIWTAAADMLMGEGTGDGCRHVDIMSDSAHVILSKESTKSVVFTIGYICPLSASVSILFVASRSGKFHDGNFAIDEDVLRAEGITDIDKYDVHPGEYLLPDFMIDPTKYECF
ncbi:hypothetical protein PFISCL1PPCAC_5898, partial [Pristionchus fissidentatus]